MVVWCCVQVLLTGEVDKYARRIQIHHPVIVRFEVRAATLVVKASILYEDDDDDEGGSPRHGHGTK